MSEHYKSVEDAQPICFYPIGRVENEINELVAPDLIRVTESRIILDASYVDALLGLEVGQEILVIFNFHRSQGFDLQQHPRRDMSRPLRGVFALRSPQRPNPIGVTRAILLAINGHILTVGNLDAINDTPVLDIKPA